MPVTPRHNQFYTIRREFRKPYMIDDSYQEMMATTWSKSVWNQILEIDPQWAEFLFTRADLPDAATAAEIRYLRYIRQSEFKKAYGDYDYPEMEYRWEGFIPTWDFDWNIDWDFPWRPLEGGGVFGEPGEGGPWVTGCFAMSESCYCAGQTADVLIEGNLPIVGIDFVFNQGETVEEYTGLNTNDVTVSINSPSTRTGQMRINVNMYDPSTGAPCVSTINIYPCEEDECCPECDLEYDWAGSDETIGAVPGSATVKVTGGTGPYSWSISGTGFTLANATTAGKTNTVNADVTACGSGEITITDSCGCTTTGAVRYTGSGTWVSICLDSSATPTPGCCFYYDVQPDGCTGGPNYTCTYTRGAYKQEAKMGMNGVQISVSFNEATQAESNAACEAGRASGFAASSCNNRCTSLCTCNIDYDCCQNCLQPSIADMMTPYNCVNEGVIINWETGATAVGHLTSRLLKCCDISAVNRIAWYLYSCWCTNQLEYFKWNCP